MIGVIDYGMGNSGSIMNILRKVGTPGGAVLASDPRELAKADALVLPGVGHYDKGMRQLHSLGLTSMLNDRVIGQRMPILGICLGMQLFANGSEEGSEPGLGWIDAEFSKFRFDDGENSDLRIPHMGWNTIRLKKANPLFDAMAGDARFYFVHSFYARCRRDDDILATTGYGIEYVSAYSKDSIIGVQFHPEKSLRWGIEVFRKFVEHVYPPEPERSSPSTAPARDSLSSAA